MKMRFWMILLLCCGTAFGIAGQEALVNAAPDGHETAPTAPTRTDATWEAPPAAASPVWRFPDMGSANIQLSWGDFKELLEAIQVPDRVPVIPTPFRSNILAVDYEVDARTPGAARVTAHYTIQVSGDHYVSLPLLDNEVAIVEVELNETPHHLTYHNGAHYFLTDEAGEHRLEVVFDVPVAQEEGRASLRMSTPHAPRIRIDLQMAPEVDAVEIREAVQVHQETQEAARHFYANLRSVEEVNIAWQLPWKRPEAAPVAPDVDTEAEIPDDVEAPEVEAPPIAPRFTASSIAYLFAEKHVIRGNAILRLNPLSGDLQEFTFETQPEIELLNVTATGAVWESKQEAEAQRVDVQFNHRLEAETQVHIQFEIPLEENAHRVEYGGFRVLDAIRQHGFLAMAPQGNVLLEADAATDSVLRADAMDMPSMSDMPAGGRQTPSMQYFRYTEPEYRVVIQLEPLEDVPVRVASVEEAAITTVITEERTAITRARFLVRNNFKQFLRITLPPGAEVWSAEVAGRAIRPAKDQNDNTVLIPLGNPVEYGGDAQRLGNFPIVLVYAEPLRAQPVEQEDSAAGEDVAGLTAEAKRIRFLDDLQLHTPALDIIVDRLEWQVHLPENRRMLQHDGDVHYRPQLASDASPPLTRQDIAPLMEALPQGVERFMITDINNPAAGGSSRQDLERRMLHLAEMASRTAGVLPVPIQVSSNTPAYRFERNIVPEGVALNLSMSTYHAAYIPYVGRLQPVVILAAGLLLGGLLVAVRRRTPWGRLRFLFLLLLIGGCAWMYVQEQASALQLAGWVFAGVVISVLYQVARHGLQPKISNATMQESEAATPTSGDA